MTMRSKLSVACAALFLAGMTSSCKKNFDCTCTFTSAPQVILPYDNIKKADAEDGCADAEATYQTVDAGASCVLTAD